MLFSIIMKKNECGYEIIARTVLQVSNMNKTLKESAF